MSRQIEFNIKSGKVEIEYSDELINQIRLKYGLESTDEVEDSMIINFLKHEVQSAIDKQEEHA